MKETALITGASGGIGLELARVFAREGFDLGLVARGEAALNALAAELRAAHGAQCTVVAADLSVADAPARVAKELAGREIVVGALVNNAGFGTMGLFHETPLARQLEMIRLNVSSLTELTHLFLPAMLARGRGRILNVASTAAFQPGPLMAVYYATKAYVLSFGEAIANELGGTGVTVTTLCPGPTRTGFQAAAGIERARLFNKMTVASAASVAEAGFRGMMNGKRVVVPGTVNWIGAQATRFVPRSLATAAARFAQETKGRT